MALQRSPPTVAVSTPQLKYPSNPDLPGTFSSKEIPFVNIRKRKTPEDDQLQEISRIVERKIDEKFNALQNDLDLKMCSLLESSVRSIIGNEVEKITLLIKNNFKEINDRLDTMEKSLSYTMERQDCLENRLVQVENKIKCNVVTSDQLTVIQGRIEHMEQQSRLFNIEISNLPERRDENLLSMMETLGNVIKHPVHTADLVSIHRVPHFDNKNTRPKNVIVKFATKILRNNFLTAAKAYKELKSDHLSISGTVQKIYINEHLTPKNKQLFRMCRIEASKQNFKYVWIKNGTILARKTDSSPIFAVRSEQDVKKIN
ncbi:hypothetical protein ACJJTC_014619 [Scirpophaga incertulas]